MTDDKLDGGPAFPFGISHIPDQGLTKRDYFASHAHIEDVKMAEDLLIQASTKPFSAKVDTLELRIKARYLVADKMLQVRGEQ